MGREHRLSRNPGVRQKGDRREAGVSAAVCRQIHRRRLAADRAVVGIDVGEDHLDLAVIEPDGPALGLSRVDMRGCERASAGAIPELARRLSRAAPTLGRGAIAVVDSPRWPVDLEWAGAFARAPLDSRPRSLIRRVESGRGRAIDQVLRGLIGELRAAGAAPLRLAMFPTPRLAYFSAQVASPACKPHLRAFGRELFGLDSQSAPPFGGTFTRFMLAGFAAYTSLARLRVTAYEGFPDLQFRLWGGDRALPSKTGFKRNGAGRAAVREARRGLVDELAARLGVTGAEVVRTLDQADAAILALSVVAVSTADCGLAVGHPAEGSFWLTLPAPLACLLRRRHD